MSSIDFNALKTELERIEKVIISKYEDCVIYENNNMACRLSNNRSIGSIGKIAFHANIYCLMSAIEEMKKDIIFTVERRGPRMDPKNPNPGKIAGVIAYRLAKSHIINMAEGCASCKHQCPQKLNYKFAIKCAFEYIDIEYLRTVDDIRRELLYSLALRHVNQETLALVFDAISLYGPPKSTPYTPKV